MASCAVAKETFPELDAGFSGVCLKNHFRPRKAFFKHALVKACSESMNMHPVSLPGRMENRTGSSARICYNQYSTFFLVPQIISGLAVPDIFS
jgi:hypothetical protein